MRVFLIHGMGRSPLSMLWLALRLRACGHRPSLFGYSVSLTDLDTIAERFVDKVQTVIADDVLHAPNGEQPRFAIVGHSLGCIITRMIADRLPEGFHRFVMLAPPNSPPAIAGALSDNPLFKMITGDAGRKITDEAFYQRLSVPDVQSLVVAGTRGPRAAWVPIHGRVFDGGANDSIVSVDEARLPGVPLVEVPGVHTFLMNRRDVFSTIRHFLATGQSPAERDSEAA